MTQIARFGMGCLTGAVVCGFSLAVAAPQFAQWETLFDGSSLAGWEVVGDANWELAQGMVQADRGSGFLVTRDSYGDFELEVEVWVDPPSNSGIFLRCASWRHRWQQCIGPAGVREATSYEVNIFDTRADQTYRTGAIVNVAPAMHRVDAGGRWNTFAITAQGTRLTVELNGTPMVDTDAGQYAEGPIALQKGQEPGTVKFRRVRLRRLSR